MAIDKKNTSLGVKIMLWVLIVAFIGLGVGTATNFAIGRKANDAKTGTQTTNPIETINAKYAATAQQLQTNLAAKPKDRDALVALGNTYMDWAGELMQSSATTAGATAAAPLWGSARDAYAKARKIKPGDSQVEGDYAVTLFYAGNPDQAIKVAVALTKADPKFAQNWFNLGIFYSAQQQKDKAIAALQEYLKLEPNGNMAANAKQIVSQLQTGK